MAVAFVKNIGSAVISMATSGSVTVPAGGVAAGNFLAVRVDLDVRTTVTVTDTQGNTYTERAQQDWGAASRAHVFECFVGTALVSGNTITASFVKSSGRIAFDEWSGVGAFDTKNSGTGTSTTASSGAITPAGVGLVFGNSGNTSGWVTEDADTAGGDSWHTLTTPGARNQGAYKVTTSATSQTYDPTFTPSSAWYSIILAWSAATDGFTADAAIAVSTSVAKVSLQPMPFPDPQTDHVINVRARCTTGSGNSLGVALYEGATNRSGDLGQTLTNTLTNYDIAISDAAAATITSYEDLEIWWWGVAVSGSTTFEVDYIGLSIPSGTRTTSFTADAVIDDGGGAVTDDFTANAAIKKTQSSSATADAVIEKTQPGSLTADATVGKTISASLAADAVVRGTQSDSAAADAVIEAPSGTKTFVADSIIEVSSGTLTMTADAVIKKGIASSLSANAVIKGTQAWSVTADAIILAAGTGSFTADAIRVATASSSADADAIVLATVSGSFSADAVIWKSVEWSFSADAWIIPGQQTQTGSFTADALIESVVTDSFTADADIFATVSGSLTAGAWLAGTFTADATIRATVESTFTASAWVAGSGVGAFSAYAVRKDTGSGSFSADAIILKPQIAAAAADAVIRATRSDSFAADAVIQKTQAISLSADAVVRANVSGSCSADAVLRATQSGLLSADAVASGATSDSLSADAVVISQASDSFAADALINRVARCIWTTPADGVQMSATPTLAFLMPQAASGNMHFQIEIDTDSGYPSPTVWTSTDPTGWEYWDGADWQPVPQAGVSNTYCGNEARYTVQSALPNDTYYRRVRAGVI